MTSIEVDTPAPAAPPTEDEPRGLKARIVAGIRSGNLGSWPVIIALVIIVAVFSQTASNFWTPVNFNNIIVQMTGTTLLAYGVVFVLLIGEIDLSIAYVSGVCGVAVAEFALPGSGHEFPAVVAIAIAILIGIAIGAFQGSIVALIGVPSFVVTLAGFQIWQGVILKSIPQGVILIQSDLINNTAGYFFGKTAGWIIAAIVILVYVGSMLTGVYQGRRHGVDIRDPLMFWIKLIGVPVVTAVTVIICNKDRGVPFALLLVIAFLGIWTYVAKRTTFGRHVYAVGGNAEAARRAGINVARIRILVFMISGGMAGIGGVVLAARLNSANLNQGGGTLLIDAISAAVIGGTSLFGGRGELRNALFGALVIATIANGLNTLGYSSGVIFIVTGVILLLAVTLDTVARRLQTKSGR
jgi:D-xylose transport system permease protein